MKNFFKKLFCSNSMSKHFSETVQRIGKNNAGFSLVELIVVIAIMAILAAVAVIGLSAYIPKAQKAADEQMIADVKKAIELYAGAETLTPGQSGYVVIHKNKGTGEVGNVTVGGTMDQMITEALAAMYGETKYGTELKVAYQKWTGTLDAGSIDNIVDSSYYENTADLLDKVQTLTNALAGFYGGDANAQDKANQATLDIANSAKNHVDNDKFVEWWTKGYFETNPSDSPYNATANIPVDQDAEAAIKFSLAAMYARAEAFVLFTGCADCKKAFDESSEGLNSVTGVNDAMNSVGEIMTTVGGHVTGGCTTCQTCMGSYDGTYFQGQAETDAKAFLSLMGQVDSMSETIKNSEEFGSDNLYNSDFVVNAVGGYVSAADAFANSGAQDGDIVIIALVDNSGKLVFKIYPTDY